MKTSLSQRSSLLINVLKCICCIGVVMLHTLFKDINVGTENLSNDGYGWNTFVDVSSIVYRTMVPLFFLISGYLMFLNYQDYSFSWFKNKFRTRIDTLLIPYLFGTFVVFLFFHIASYALTGLMASGSTHSYNILTMFWHPLPNKVLWFLRDLMVVIILSPLVVKIMEWSKWLTLLLIFCLWFTDVWRFQIPGFSSISFLFFYIGVYLACRKIDFIELTCNLKGKSLVVLFYAVIVISAFIFQSEYLTKLSIFGGIPAIIIITNYTFTPPRLQFFNSAFWMPASFFIYIYHVMTEVVLKKILFVIIQPQNALLNYVIYFVTVCATIAILSFIYWLLKRYIPIVAKLLTGR